ncbi:MAG: 3-phosphoshikimate 1-carboxyvinyltransferase [Gammaproteobacteria bacterium]|jgi:3-phosphoshikimate 1-carboxyvinyltransferase|nr:3-phosphoshikimate 1-carboxyvinyltransferase [Gammaproteobacteria bacterium]
MSNTQSIVAEPGTAAGGKVRVPGDKSVSHRALMLGAIATGDMRISGFLPGEDCLATLAALRALGADIELDGDSVKIRGVGMHGLRASHHALDMGNSGTGMRLLAGLLAGQAFDSELTGDDSLRSRPMERIAAPLREMGAAVSTHEGRAPLTIRGGRTLTGIDYRSPVASAQIKSAVLLAGLYAQGRTCVYEPGVSRDHTERMLQTFGVEVETGAGYAALRGPAALRACDVQVPGDLSSAAFVLGAACLATSGITEVQQVGVNPTRTGLLEILRLMGADIVVVNPAVAGAEPIATLRVSPAPLRGVEIPAELVPLAIDELPLVFALAACATGQTVVSGASELRHKESDRIATMATGLRALGIRVDEREDGAVIHGGAVQGGAVDSTGDHRIAMAFAVLAGRAQGAVTIADTANIATSFPGFTALMNSLGLRLHEAGSA